MLKLLSEVAEKSGNIYFGSFIGLFKYLPDTGIIKRYIQYSDSSEKQLDCLKRNNFEPKFQIFFKTGVPFHVTGQRQSLGFHPFQGVHLGGTGLADAVDQCLVTHFQVQPGKRLFFIRQLIDRFCGTAFDDNFNLPGNGIPGINTEVGQNLVELGRIQSNPPCVRCREPNQLDVLADEALQHGQEGCHRPVQIQDLGLHCLPPGEGQELLLADRERRAPLENGGPVAAGEPADEAVRMDRPPCEERPEGRVRVEARDRRRVEPDRFDPGQPVDLPAEVAPGGAHDENSRTPVDPAQAVSGLQIGHPEGVVDDFPVENGENAGHSEAYRAGVGIGGRPERRGAIAEDLRFR